MGILSCKGNGNIMAGSEDRREIYESMGRSTSTKLRPVILSRVRLETSRLGDKPLGCAVLRTGECSKACDCSIWTDVRCEDDDENRIIIDTLAVPSPRTVRRLLSLVCSSPAAKDACRCQVQRF